MCLVRIEKMPKLQTSCTITCTDGMVVTTQSEEIEKAQRGMTEFLLANHPLDCPVCDRGGECELQEMTFDWGGIEERFTEKKNYAAERYLSPMVANDRNDASSVNVAHEFATNGWAKMRSRPVVAERTRSLARTWAGSIVHSVATALKSARREHSRWYLSSSNTSLGTFANDFHLQLLL
jgi:hypothetical protein